MNDDERQEKARGLFRKYDDHGERAYRKWIVCQILDLVTQDEIAAVGRLHWQILEHFYRRNRTSSQIAAYLMLREQDVPAYKTQAIKRLRDVFESPRNDWHRLVVMRGASEQVGDADKASNSDSVRTGAVAGCDEQESNAIPVVADEPAVFDPQALWNEHDSTTAYSLHRGIIARILAGADEAILAQIPPLELQALQCYAAGKTDAQCVSELGWAKQTYRVRKARAIERLRTLTIGIPEDQIKQDVAVAGVSSEQESEQESDTDVSAIWDELATTSSYVARRKLVEQVFSLLDPTQLTKLSVQDIAVLTLYIRGCTDEQIAGVLDATKQVAKNRKHEAIEHLRAVSLGQDIVRPSRDTKREPSENRTHHKEKTSSPRASNGEETGEEEDEDDDCRIPPILKVRKYPKSERDAAFTAYLADRTNPASRDQVVKCYYYKVAAIAVKYKLATGKLCEMEDLVGHGLVGLVLAMEKYDAAHESGASFDTYATYYIKGEILDGWKEDTGKAEHLSTLERLRKKEDRGETLTPEESELKEDLTQKVFGTWELDRQMSEDSDAKLLDVIPDTALTPEYALLEAESEEEKRQTYDRIVELFDRLPWKWRIVIEQRLIHGKSLCEAGRLAGMSESWACRVYKQALEVVQRMARRERLRFPPSLL